MRMKVSTRIILTIYLVVVILLCAFLLTTATGLISPDYLAGAVGTVINGDITYKIIYAAACAVMIILGFVIMFFGIRGNKKNIVLKNSQNGKICIGIAAVEELAVKYIKSNPLVKSINIKTRSVKNMPDISMKVSVPCETDITAITDSLQTGLGEYLERHLGVKAKNIEINVVQIDTAAAAPVLPEINPENSEEALITTNGGNE